MTSPLGLPGPAGVLRRFVYGDVPLDEWVAKGAAAPVGPQVSFERARQLVHADQIHEAVKIWWQLAFTEGLESRQTLQAWHFLRQAGYRPPADRAKLVLGAVAESPEQGTHNVLAAYQDGTARYLAYSGKALIWEDSSVTEIQMAIGDWLASGQAIADATEAWDQPSLPPLLAGYGRVMVLTPGGPRFRQSPAAAVGDPMAGLFLAAAIRLLRLLMNREMA